MAKLLTPLNQAALKAEDFSKIERENKEISVSYDRGFFHHVKRPWEKTRSRRSAW